MWVGIVPIKGHATELCGLHIHRNGVPLVEGCDQQLHVGYVCVEDQEIIDYEGKYH